KKSFAAWRLCARYNGFKRKRLGRLVLIGVFLRSRLVDQGAGRFGAGGRTGVRLASLGSAHGPTANEKLVRLLGDRRGRCLALVWRRGLARLGVCPRILLDSSRAPLCDAHRSRGTVLVLHPRADARHVAVDASAAVLCSISDAAFGARGAKAVTVVGP